MKGEIMKLKQFHIILFLSIIITACASSTNEIVLVSGIASEDPQNFVWGFGFEGEKATSPGPTITVRKGETVTITFKNEALYEDGRIDSNRHNFLIVADKDANSSAMVPLWGAEVGGNTNYDEDIKTGESASVTFVPDEVGEFYYICNSVGHFTFGMWGRLIVLEAEE